MLIRIICRAIVLDQKTKKILLVRNRGAKFWYPPGGGWEAKENLTQCVVREVREETNISIEPLRLLYVQEFSPNQDETSLELFWLAKPLTNPEITTGHLDIGGIVEESRWFSRSEMRKTKIFPKKLKKQFWIDIQTLSSIPDQFIN